MAAPANQGMSVFGVGHNSARFAREPKGGSMWAIVFDLDTATLEQTYPTPSWGNAYSEVRKVLEQRGFDWQQGSTYFGGESVNEVTCVLAVQELSRTYEWFKPSVQDIRMLRIEGNSDLAPAL